MSRAELLTRVWGYDRTADIETRTVDIHIAKLRRKIEVDAKEPRNLVTVRGAGYRLLAGALECCARDCSSKLDERQVRWLLAVVLSRARVPAVLLIAQATASSSGKRFAAPAAGRGSSPRAVDADLRAAVAAEDARSFGDYSFLVVEGDAAANFVQRSPLSAFPVESAVRRRDRLLPSRRGGLAHDAAVAGGAA